MMDHSTILLRQLMKGEFALAATQEPQDEALQDFRSAHGSVRGDNLLGFLTELRDQLRPLDKSRHVLSQLSRAARVENIAVHPVFDHFLCASVLRAEDGLPERHGLHDDNCPDSRSKDKQV